MSLRAKRSNLRAETILEVIIAVTLFMIIMGPASALYISSTRTIGMNRNDLVAASLAEEGVEMLRNMRDTNFLRFSQKATECWNALPEYTDLADCEISGNKIGADFYRLSVDVAGDWKLEAQPELHREPSAPGQPLGDYDLGDPNDSDFQLKLDPAATHPYNYYSTTEPSNFYRQIEVEYLNLDTSDEADADEEGMRVISTVLYRTGASVRKIQRALIFTNQR